MRTALIVVCAVLLAGCGKTPPPPAAKEAAPEYFKPDPATAGKLSGTVRFQGAKPPARILSMNAEEACEKLNPQPVTEPTVVLGAKGALANTVVYVKSGLEGKTFSPPTEAVILDQRGCMFVPRVVALRTGQTLSVHNGDPVSHNIHPRPENNREWNQQQQPGAPDLQRRFARPEMIIPVKCNIHAWMKSYIAVLDHPYFAVTSESGTFTWPALPPGEYTVAAWHEVLGELTQKVLIAPKADASVAFTFRRQ